MQLYKNRSFGDYFSDTIAFFRSTGKHFFKNFFLINGGFIIIIALLLFFLTKIYMTTVFGMTMNQSVDTPYIFTYFADNAPLFITLIAALVIMSVFLSILNITFPIVYLQLYDKHGNNNFETAEIVGELKKNLGKMFSFMLGFLFVLLPLIAVTAGILILLSFILIGIPLMLIVIPAMVAWISLSYHEYILGSSGFFSSLSNGFNMLRQRFWNIWGATTLWMLILQMLQGAVTIIPYLIGIATVVAGMSTGGEQADAFSTLAVFMAGMMVFTVIVSYFLNNALIVAQGLIYFSIKEQRENRGTTSVIDEIGGGY